ncbi:MAG: mechanosensitive ion channel domain-containing protein [Thermoprotei archaeon]|nr:mechanosensitive ion channel [TACK group archaeon]
MQQFVWPGFPLLTVLYAALIVVICALAIWIINHSLNKALTKIPSSIIRDLEIAADLFIVIIGIAAIYSLLGVTLNVFLILVFLILIAGFIAAKDAMSSYISTYVIRSSNAIKPGDWIETQGIRGTAVRVDNFYTIVQRPDGLITYVNNANLFKEGFTAFSPLTTKYVEINLEVPLSRFKPEVYEKIKELAEEASKASGKGESPEVLIYELAFDAVKLKLRIPVTNPRREDAIKSDVLEKALNAIYGQAQ